MAGKTSAKGARGEGASGANRFKYRKIGEVGGSLDIGIQSGTNLVLYAYAFNAQQVIDYGGNGEALEAIHPTENPDNFDQDDFGQKHAAFFSRASRQVRKATADSKACNALRVLKLGIRVN
ncbi:hypothetical protein [Candidatus Accumulibacter aalborgensis]|uniref:hypothetical protein n=1 Tax=Candidatus Accumulibacter aalborgensis TaxID=1860102 RepID=UPI00164436BC|nr:hypothetical protein [Candidatus Accumulibacter aalborgensis]